MLHETSGSVGTPSMYEGVNDIFSKYWAAYGGVKALVRSPYLHAAILLLAITSYYWIFDSWWKDVKSVIPSLLGFTLGGFAVFIGFGDEKFRQLLAEPDESDNIATSPTKHINRTQSIYTELCSTFVHFIVIQCISLLYSIVYESLQFYSPRIEPFRELVYFGTIFFSGIGFLLYLYALTSILAATMHLFRIATMYEEFQKFNTAKDTAVQDSKIKE